MAQVAAVTGDFAALARSLVRKAGHLARAEGARRLLRRRRDDGSYWHQPRLLWPLFTAHHRSTEGR